MTTTTRTLLSAPLPGAPIEIVEAVAEEERVFERESRAALGLAGLRVLSAVRVGALIGSRLRAEVETDGSTQADLVLLPRAVSILTVYVPSRGGLVGGVKGSLLDGAELAARAVASRPWTPFVSTAEYAALDAVRALALPDAREGNEVLEDLRRGEVDPDHYPALLAAAGDLASGAPVEWVRRRLDLLDD